MANTIGDAQLPAVDRRSRRRAGEVRHRRYVRGVRERAPVGCAPSRLRLGGLADPARALADQPQVDLRDREGGGRLLDDELPRRLRRPRCRDSHVQRLRASPEPALRHTIITQALSRPEVELGALEPLRDFCFCTDGVRGHLTVAAQGIPGDLYVYGQGANISMADWCDLILRSAPSTASGPPTATSSSTRDGCARARPT